MPIATIALKVWQWRLLATSVAIVACLGACGSGWKSLGEQHAAVADALGVKGVRFGAEFDAWARGLVDDECLHLRPEASRLEPAKKQQLELFRSKFCRPWLETWDSSLKVCESAHSPTWCTGPMHDGVALQDYFVVMSGALRTTADGLQRYNLMMVVISATMPHVITQFPLDRVDQWVAEATGEFLAQATPDEALEVGRLLQHTWVGVGPAIARRFTIYVASRPLTEEQRRSLSELVKRRHSE